MINVSFRDKDDEFPESPSLPTIKTLSPEERVRRARNHEALCVFLVALTGKDRDEFTCATYGELISMAREALQNESERIPMKSENSDERMRALIAQAKDAATIRDNTSGGMGLSPRPDKFSDEVINRPSERSLKQRAIRSRIIT